MQWSRSRNRYERQGILPQPEAIQRALASEADSEERAQRREGEAVRREGLDRKDVVEFAHAIREQFPRIPAGGGY